jgi:peptidoglycan endopeptidase LytE
VNKGDQLLKIAKSFGITLDSIKSLNGLKNDSIGVGNVIRVKETTKFEGC